MAEGNGLENRRRETVPEFESLLLRHILAPGLSQAWGFLHLPVNGGAFVSQLLELLRQAPRLPALQRIAQHQRAGGAHDQPQPDGADRP